MKKMFILTSIILVIFAAFTLIIKREKTDTSITKEYKNYYTNNLSVEEFKQNMINKKELFIYFYQTDCSHCKAASPIVIPLAKEMKIDLKVVNLQNEPKSTWDELEVTGTPTVVHFKDGKEINRLKGAVNKEKYKQWFSDTLKL